MSPETMQSLFNIFMMVGLGMSGLLAGLKSKQVKKLEQKIPDPPTDETLARDRQVLRDEINREVGVQLDKANKQIKALETDNEKNKHEIESLKTSITTKDNEIAALNRQVSRLEREHEQEEAERKTAQESHLKAEKEKAELGGQLKVWELAVKLVQDTVSRPIQITVNLEGVTVKEIKSEESKSDIAEGEKTG